MTVRSRSLVAALAGALLCAGTWLYVPPAARADDPAAGGSSEELDSNGTVALPISLPERPFLLLEAPRRYLPSEPAEVRVQLSGGGRVSLAVFRILDPTYPLAAGRQRQGIALAQSALGREAEALLVRTGRLPRRGRALELVTVRGASLRRPGARRGRVHDETIVYDSYESEESDVETWGVRAGDWSEARVGLGRLGPGVYLVRAHKGPFATAALLSVGEITLLVRRGDVRDTVLVTSADGAPRGGAEVTVWASGRRVATARTDDSGRASLPARDDPSLRFVAIVGPDRTWADATHARLSRCDPMVYLGVDRPVFRRGETIHLRGHVRGCEREDYRPLANERVRVWPARQPDGRDDEQGREVVTDRDGNFVVELDARGDLGARVRGVRHERRVTIDSRSLPERSLVVSVDRTWAAAGQTVAVTVADAEGGWPRVAVVGLDAPGGRQVAPIGPGRPATFTVTMPPTDDVLRPLSLVASLGEHGTVTFARTEIWTGARPELLHLDADRAVADEGDELDVVLRATDLGGALVAGDARLEVIGSDGNRAIGAARWQGSARLATTGPTRPRVRLLGRGPWLVRAAMRGATASLVVWDRPRPPPLSGRGPLAVRPTVLVAQPGGVLDVELRLPEPGGAAWVTLEQGTVWASAMAERPRTGGLARVRLQVPGAARGMATIVASWVRRGRVQTATATVEVETSRALALRVATDRGTYDRGANARLTIEARGVDGRPRDAVVSVWVSDAGYWDLGEETYPLPREMLRLPGRSASAADGTIPVAYGADEGRHVDAFMEWNGRRQPRMTFRHAWMFGGDLVRVDRRGPVTEVLTVLARAAGLARAEVCADDAQRVGRVRLRVQDLPWDMVALRVAELIETPVRVEHGVLLFPCGVEGYGSGAGYGSGRGSATPHLRAGAASRDIERERLEGTLRFIGLLRLGEDGREEVTLAMPDHPGRWRAEVLAIADDGGGDRAGVTVHTTQPLQLALDLPADLVTGDVARGVVRVEAPSLASRVVTLRTELPAGIALLEPPADRLTLDARGRGQVPLAVRAEREGRFLLGAAAESGGQRDAIVRALVVRPSYAVQPVALSAVVGPRAAEIRLPLPELAGSSVLGVELDRDPLDAVARELETLSEPRWNLPVMRLDKLASLVALRDAVVAVGREPAGAAGAEPDESESRAEQLRYQVERAIASQLSALSTLRSTDDGVGWWSHLPSLPSLTAELAWQTRRAGRHTDDGTWAYLRSQLDRGRVSAAEQPVLTAAFAASANAEDQQRAQRMLASLDGASGDHLERDTWLLRAALSVGDGARIAALGTRLRGALERAIERRPERSSRCAGPAWFLCFARWGTRGSSARAARTLLEASRWTPPAPRPQRTAGRAPTAPPPPPVIDPGPTRALGARVADWLGLWPGERSRFTWGSGEAEVVGLVAALGARGAAAARFTVTLDGRRIGGGNGRTDVTVSRGRDLIVRFDASPGRAAILHVTGELRISPPHGDVGPSGLTRRFEAGENGWSAIVGFELARDTEHVELGIPLPAGVSLAGAADRTSLSVREGGAGGWSTLDDPRAAGAPRVEIEAGALRVRWRHVRQGRHELRVPLVAVAAGELRAAPTWLHTSDDQAWGVTPEATTRIELPSAPSPP